LVSIAQVQEIPLKNMILLVGPPGSGKSTFCQQVALQSLAMDRPVIFVTTEYGPPEVERGLKEQGLREIQPGLLNFVDVYHETVGLSVSDRPDTIHANCEDLSSIGMAIAKLSERIERKDIQLIFDSLTSPYIFGGSEVLRFVKMTLSRFAAEKNAVLAGIDEGCGKSEDLVAMMSLSNGVIKMETEDGKRMLNVVKHPLMKSMKIEIPGAEILEKLWNMEMWREEILTMALQMVTRGAGTLFRSEIGDYVNLFWPNFVYWSCMLWDPKRFPEMRYEMSKMHGEGIKEMMMAAPWHQRMLFKQLLPKNLSKVRNMKKMAKVFHKMLNPMRAGIFEYLEDASKTDEHYFRVSESFECWGFEDVGAPMASMFPPSIAGSCKGVESWKGIERDWNAVEVKCIGLGNTHCVTKLVPGEIDELEYSLGTIDSAVLDRMHDRLWDRLRGFLLDTKPLVERPNLGSDVALNAIMHGMFQPALAGERFRVVMRMAGAKAGKMVGERLMEVGLREEEAVKRVLNFLEFCKVGQITIGETMRIKENCESVFARFRKKKWKEPCCYFTTGFFNGFFFAVKNQHIKEVKCGGLGDPYCEWEFR
jgi:KaiC/GvpD/RAD55 family RecA-like ATPase/predicted hydrocarbon binding protein